MMFAQLHSVPMEKSCPRWATARNYYGAYLLQDDSGRFVLKAKMYVTSTYSANGCCLWLALPDGTHIYTHGKASGYGYDRESAAFVNALVNAGADAEELRLAGIQGGVGMSAIIPVIQRRLGIETGYFYIGE